jgi:hypothetical protein
MGGAAALDFSARGIAGNERRRPENLLASALKVRHSQCRARQGPVSPERK